MLRTGRLRSIGVITSMALLLACDSDPVGVHWQDGFSALFIGNSITYWKEIPGIVAAMADSSEIDAYDVQSAAQGGWSLRSHWHFDLTRNLVQRGGWDVVVLQGYTGVGETRDSLVKYARLFAEEAASVGARAALFMRNPPIAYPEQVDEIAAVYTEIALETDAILLPVALAWREVWRRDPDFVLYDDDVHPNIEGSYLAGLVILQSLTGKSPIGMPSALTLDRGWFRSNLVVSPEDAAFLQEVAAFVAAER